MFPQLKWYYIIVAYIFAPSLAFCNAFGAGLTNINMAYNYGKVALFLLATVAGKENGVVAGLVGNVCMPSSWHIDGVCMLSSELLLFLRTGICLSVMKPCGHKL